MLEVTRLFLQSCNRLSVACLASSFSSRTAPFSFPVRVVHDRRAGVGPTVGNPVTPGLLLRDPVKLLQFLRASLTQLTTNVLPAVVVQPTAGMSCLLETEKGWQRWPRASTHVDTCHATYRECREQF